MATDESSKQTQLSRTQWAEREVENFLSLPLVTEFVFRSPQAIMTTQKEVVDFLVLNGPSCILISQKCQENPEGRDVRKTESWARKKAKEAASQLIGALKRPTDRAVWCDHPRRGRVDFPNGLPKIEHGIVVVEVMQPVDLQPEASNLPLIFGTTSISYLSLNDFLNLAVELRTIPELLEYLMARRSLPAQDLHRIGDEKSLFEFYLLNDGSMEGCTSRAFAREKASGERLRMPPLLAAKAESDRYSKLLEHVVDQLATRNPNYTDGVAPAQLARFEPSDSRRGYLDMQGLLGNLRLSERVELGRSFSNVIDRLRDEPRGFTYMAAQIDSLPDFVFVFGSFKKLDRATLLQRLEQLATGAMSFYEKSRCLAVIDRDGESYECGLVKMGSPPTQSGIEEGIRLFGQQRVSSRQLNLVPNH